MQLYVFRGQIFLFTKIDVCGLKKKTQTFALLCTIIFWLKFCVITQNLEYAADFFA